MSSRPLTQRWQFDRDHAQPVEELFSKCSCLDLGCQILVGRADDAAIHGYRRHGPQPPQGPLLHKPEEPRLKFHPQVTDLVQKQRSFIRRFDESFLSALCPGEGAALIPEEFALDQRPRHGAALDRHKRTILAPALVMNEPGHHLLARTALAQNHERCVRGGRPAALAHLVQHDRAAALRFFCLAECLQAVFQRFDFVLKLGVGEGPIHHQLQFLALERLLQIIEGPIAYRQHGALH